MGFTAAEAAEHLKVLENTFWSRHRRFTGYSLELFIVRPAFQSPGERIEVSIAKVQSVPSLNLWHLFWKRSNRRWESFEPRPETDSFAEALRAIDEDAHACFFG